MTKAPKPTMSSLQIQLETLQTGITVHGNRMWQLPFTYVSFAAIAASLVIKDETILSPKAFFWVLSAVGILVLWAMIDALVSYQRTANAMNIVEESLHLQKFTKASFWHAAPHFALCSAAIVAFAMAGSFVGPDRQGVNQDEENGIVHKEATY